VEERRKKEKWIVGEVNGPRKESLVAEGRNEKESGEGRRQCIVTFPNSPLILVFLLLPLSFFSSSLYPSRPIYLLATKLSFIWVPPIFRTVTIT
jgi:hypothetical protein